MKVGFLNALRDMLGVGSPGDVRAAVMHFIGAVSQELIKPINEAWKTAVQGELTTLAKLTATEPTPVLLCAMAKVTLIKLGVAGPLAADVTVTAKVAAEAAEAEVAAVAAVEAAAESAAGFAAVGKAKTAAEAELAAATAAAATAATDATTAADAAKAAKEALVNVGTSVDTWWGELGGLSLSQLWGMLSPLVIAAEPGAEAAKVERWKTFGALYVAGPPLMDWKWPAEHSVECKDYHPRIGDGQEEVGGWAGTHKLANACNSSGAGLPFSTYADYGVNGADYVDFIFTFDDRNTWCSGYRQSGPYEQWGTPTFTQDVEIYTGDANFGPWTKVATDSHSTWHNGGTPTFPDGGTTTEWTPTAPSKYLLVRTLTNHGDTGWGGRLIVRFLQLKFGVAPN